MKYPVRPGIYLPGYPDDAPSHAYKLWTGEKKVIVKSRRFDKYNRVIIYWFDKDYVYGTLILGEPKGPLTREQAKKLKDESTISDEEFEHWWPDANEFWVWRPRIIMRFKKPKKHPKWEGVQTFKRQVVITEDLQEDEYGPPYAPVPRSGKQLGPPIRVEDVIGDGLKPIVLQDNFVNLTGGIVNAGETEGDVDIPYRAPSPEPVREQVNYLLHLVEALPDIELKGEIKEAAAEVWRRIVEYLDFWDNGIRFRLYRYLEGKNPELKGRFHIFPDLRGPITSYIPLYRLMLVPYPKLRKVEMSELELAEDPAAKKIRELIESGRWEKIKADERVELMKKQKKITPPLPIVPTKTSKAGYRELELFEKRSVAKLAQEWLKEHPGESIYVETKFDGMRLLLVKHGKKAYMWTEGGEEVADVLPNLRKDLLSLNVNTVYLDSEVVPYDEEGNALGRRAAVAAMGKKVVDDSRWIAHVFDCIYMNGEQLWKKPYEERRKILRGIELPRGTHPKSFKFHLLENMPIAARTVEEVLKAVREKSEVPFSEGAMLKLSGSIYPIDKRTPEWAKYKIFADVDVLAVAKFPKLYRTGPQKGKPIPGVWIWVGAVGPVKPPKGAKIWEPEELTHKGVKTRKQRYVRWKGKVYTILGLTFASAEKIKPGDIIRVTVRLIRKESPTEYNWLIPRVLEKRPEKTEPDPLTVVDAIARKTQYRIKKEEKQLEEAEETYEALDEYIRALDFNEQQEVLEEWT